LQVPVSVEVTVDRVEGSDICIAGVDDKVGVIECVVKFQAELERKALRYFGVLANGKV
jgi:hypothetical protein